MSPNESESENQPNKSGQKAFSPSQPLPAETDRHAHLKQNAEVENDSVDQAKEKEKEKEKKKGEKEAKIATVGIAQSADAKSDAIVVDSASGEVVGSSAKKRKRDAANIVEDTSHERKEKKRKQRKQKLGHSTENEVVAQVVRIQYYANYADSFLQSTPAETKSEITTEKKDKKKKKSESATGEVPEQMDEKKEIKSSKRKHDIEVRTSQFGLEKEDRLTDLQSNPSSRPQ
jgi:hypothetical protein